MKMFKPFRIASLAIVVLLLLSSTLSQATPETKNSGTGTLRKDKPNTPKTPPSTPAKPPPAEPKYKPIYIAEIINEGANTPASNVLDSQLFK